MRGWEVPPRRQSVLCDRHLSPSTLVVCEHPAALRSVRCWVVPGRNSSSSASSVRRVPSLHSAVSLRLGHTWPLFLQALQASAFQNVKALLSSRAAQRHRHFLGSDSQSLPGVQEAAVRIRSRLLGQHVSAPLRYGPHPAPVAPHQRCCLVPQFDGRCLFASTVLPRPTVSAALTR